MSDAKEHESQEQVFLDDEEFRDEFNPVDADGYPQEDEDYPEDTVTLTNKAQNQEVTTQRCLEPKEGTELLNKDALQEQEKKELIRQDISDIQIYMFSELGITIGADDPIIYSLLYNKSLFQNALTDYEAALKRVTLDLDKKLKEIYEFSEKMQENKKQFLVEIVSEHTKQRRKTVGQIDQAVVEAVNLALEKAGFTEEQPIEAASELKTMKYLLWGVLAASILNFFI